jgi:glycosyltransferase EpsE
VAAVGTYVALFDECGVSWGELRHPLTPAVRDWVRGSKVLHASVVMRAKEVRNAGKYDEHALRVEDYDLWLRLVGRGSRIATIPLVLYFVHWDRSDYGRRRYIYRIIESKVRWRGYRAMGVSMIAYAYAIKPLLVGLLPHRLVYRYHFAKYKASSRKTHRLDSLLESGSGSHDARQDGSIEEG